MHMTASILHTHLKYILVVKNEENAKMANVTNVTMKLACLVVDFYSKKALRRLENVFRLLQ